MTTRTQGPTGKNSRLMNVDKYPSFVSPVRPATVIAIESGQGDDGTYSYFIRVRTADVVTYEEGWSRNVRARERFERVVENHIEGRALGI